MLRPTALRSPYAAPAPGGSALSALCQPVCYFCARREKQAVLATETSCILRQDCWPRPHWASLGVGAVPVPWRRLQCPEGYLADPANSCPQHGCEWGSMIQLLGRALGPLPHGLWEKALGAETQQGGGAAGTGRSLGGRLGLDQSSTQVISDGDDNADDAWGGGVQEAAWLPEVLLQHPILGTSWGMGEEYRDSNLVSSMARISSEHRAARLNPHPTPCSVHGSWLQHQGLGAHGTGGAQSRPYSWLRGAQCGPMLQPAPGAAQWVPVPFTTNSPPAAPQGSSTSPPSDPIFLKQQGEYGV